MRLELGPDGLSGGIGPDNADGPWLRIGAEVPEGVSASVQRAGDGTVRFTLTADRDLTFTPRGVAEPHARWPLLSPTDGLAERGVRTFGYQYMEFALPSAGGADGHGLAPWPLRPPAAMPVVWGHPDGGDVCLVGPLDHVHDQLMAVPSDERPRHGVACGWQGDLATVPAGFSTTVVALEAPSVRAAIARYGRLLRHHHGAAPIGRYADPGVSAVSYWTDNGATYYYRPAPGMDIRDTLREAVARCRADGLPLAAVQLDSWFYPRAVPRPIADGAPVVPPSGTTTWDGRPDAFPDGLGAFTRSLGLPVILHSRHLDASSPYFAAGGPEGWIDALTGSAHGAGDELFDIWMEQAASWGACTYEQDWLVEAFLTVAPLRAAVGRAAAWQASMDRAAARRGLTLQWCMATPADMLGTVHLRRVSSVRTSMDFRYAVGRLANWGWFLHVNALARALGLNTSKDVFLSGRDEEGRWVDPLAEAETLLAAMSCGPVGIGDAIGTTDVALVQRACRPDGVLVMPDVAVAALERGFLDVPMPDAGVLAAETYSDHPAGRHHYVLAVGDPADGGPTTVTARLDELDHGAHDAGRSAVAHRWTTGEVRRLRTGSAVGDGHELILDVGDRHFDLWLVAPTLCDGRLAVFGDVTRYASMGDRRIGRCTDHGDRVTLSVYGVAGEVVELCWWSAGPVVATGWLPNEGESALQVERDDRGRSLARVTVGIDGWRRVTLRP